MCDEDDPFAELERNNLEFKRVIEQIPEETIVGLVGERGAGGASFLGEDWKLILSLVAWKKSSGELSQEELRVEFPLPEESVSQYMSEIDPFAIVKIKARCAQHPNGFLQAVASEIISTNESDSDLKQIVEERQVPIIIEDPQFGPLTLNRVLDRFSGSVLWDDVDISLELSCDETGSIQESLTVARKLWEQQSDWADQVKDFAVLELLERKNNGWLEEDQPEVTAEAFKKRMVLESILIYSDGEFEFWHDDGDLFWGHAIQVSGNLTEGLTYVDTPG
ncbi:DUF2262 domain-containing protein [Gimesia sp.]|uniref:DUF2262 domain-containing protein n=1 Tax=Gimesia sp. TaxID=2024833 RepID=UPI000C64C648|nr:DUF2262 domain-containing protein [Gimesia sp.]MAX34980.1 hypothetical protein [Gimesia sp.]HBL44088.1 hypothetical protein [Planctomycetaceae bacterium]